MKNLNRMKTNFDHAWAKTIWKEYFQKIKCKTNLIAQQTVDKYKVTCFMLQTKIGCMALAQSWWLWKFQTNSQIKNWTSNRSNLQWWNFVNMKVMDYNTRIYMHSSGILTLNPLFVHWKGSTKHYYAIWLFDESTHKEDLFLFTGLLHSWFGSAAWTSHLKP